MNMKEITNGHKRPILWWSDLTLAEQNELDYLDDSCEGEPRFFRYRGNVYDLGDMMRPHESMEDKYDAIETDSFFSAVGAKIVDDNGNMAVVITLLLT